jgi:RNA polymerase sigma-70 factor (ECF subfamily)
MNSYFSEKILFARVKNKDQEAFIEAYDRYVDRIYRFIFYKISDGVEAQDLTSAVFLKAWNHIQQNSLTDEKTLPALFYKIARTTVIDHYRKTSNENKTSLDSGDETIDLPDAKQDLNSKLELASDLELVNEKLLELKDEYKEVIILRYIDELSIGEIAAVLDKKKGNVRILLFRAIKALKELVNDNK